MTPYSRKILLTLALLLTLSAVGCNSPFAEKDVDLNTIYGDLAQLPDHHRNPVIVIPGILGSRLEDPVEGEIVWGELGLKTANPLRQQALKNLALPMQRDVPLRNLQDQVEVNGPLDQLSIRVAKIPVRIDAYSEILSALGVGGYRDERSSVKSPNQVNYGNDHFTCYQFSYDWRRDISETAGELDIYIKKIEKDIRKTYQTKFGIENPDIKFDIVAHSMGGLLARYYLRYGNQVLPDDGSFPELNWAGTESVGRLIMVGTPNAGSTEAIEQLIDGLRLAKPLPAYPPAIVGTMPAAYQLLPRTRHNPVVNSDGESIDIFDPQIWAQFNWGLAADNQDKHLRVVLPEIDDAAERHEIAVDHQAKCLQRAQQLHQSLDIEAPLPANVELHLFAGDAKPTLHQIVVDANGKIIDRINTAGDTTVTRTSAAFEERAGFTTVDSIPWTNKTFISSDHLGLTKDRVFVNNVLSTLLHKKTSTLDHQ